MLNLKNTTTKEAITKDTAIEILKELDGKTALDKLGILWFIKGMQAQKEIQEVKGD